MAIIAGIKEGVGEKIRKKMIGPSSYGIKRYGGFHYGSGAKTHGIYRVRHRWNKVIQEKMEFWWPADPKTEAQLNRRGIFSDAVAAYQALTPEQKEFYNKIAEYQNYSGYNLFISEYLLSN